MSTITKLALNTEIKQLIRISAHSDYPAEGREYEQYQYANLRQKMPVHFDYLQLPPFDYSPEDSIAPVEEQQQLLKQIEIAYYALSFTQKLKFIGNKLAEIEKCI